MPEMPFYICHKRVQALEILEVGNYYPDPHGTKLLRAVRYDGGSIGLSQDLFQRYVPVPGDFLVRYEDGYESFSPRKAFLDGYTREEAIEALPQRIDQALAQEPNTPFITGELQELLRDCRAEILGLRGHTDGSLLMERLIELSHLKAGDRSPDWVFVEGHIDPDKHPISRIAREAYVTINSLKQQIERLKADTVITRQMAGFKEVKNAQTDQA